MQSGASPKGIPQQRQARAKLRAAAWTVGAILLWALACEARPQVVLHTRGGPVRVRVEIADTPESRARGLMYRKDLADNAGMLFVFPQEDRLEFWMKNTPLSLDMIFFGADRRVVGIVERAQPFSTTPRGPGVPAQYVLEVRAGFVERHGVQVGDRADFLDVPSAKR